MSTNICANLSETTGTLLDCWRTKHPLERSYTRFSTTYRTSQSRIDFFLASPLTLSAFPLLSSEIECWNKTTDHHPVNLIIRSPELATHSETPPKPDLLQKPNSLDVQAFKNKLEPLNTWCLQHLPLLPNISPDTVIHYTDALIHQFTSIYYSFTNPSPHKPSKLEHTFAQLINSLPSPHDHSFLIRFHSCMTHTRNGKTNFQEQYHQATQSTCRRITNQKDLERSTEPTDKRKNGTERPQIIRACNHRSTEML